MKHRPIRHRLPAAHLVAAGSSFLVVAMLAACDLHLLDAPARSRVPLDSLNTAAMMRPLVAGAVADFECALANFVTGTDDMADELKTAGLGGMTTWDRRALLANSAAYSTADCLAYASFTLSWAYGVYTPLSTARFEADDVFRRIVSFPPSELPGRDSLLAVAAAYGGYSYTLFGEAFCWAAFDLGKELAPNEVLAMAEEHFSVAESLAQLANSSDVLNLAHVGRARVRLDLGDLTGAAADAKLVPAGYVKYAARAVGNDRLANVVYIHNNKFGHVTVDARYRGLTVGGIPDPRVPVTNAGKVGSDGSTPLWVQTKYRAASDGIPIATWNEAQLIIAEAEGGQSAVNVVNALRAKAGLPATFASGNPTAIRDTVREERRRELFLDGHRLNDMLRWNLPLDVGSLYGTTARLPLPQAEIDNNPNITKPLDGNPPGRGCMR